MTRILKKELWPYCVPVEFTGDIDKNFINVDIDKMERWLSNLLGPFKEQWNIVYLHNRTDFYFRNEQDAVFFSLKWV
jgi:hypothetical protein